MSKTAEGAIAHATLLYPDAPSNADDYVKRATFLNGARFMTELHGEDWEKISAELIKNHSDFMNYLERKHG